MYIRNPGHMTKMAAMPIYGKNPSKIFSRTGELISRKLGMKHRWLKHCNVYINEPPRGKTNNVVSDQVRHKPACTVTEAG